MAHCDSVEDGSLESCRCPCSCATWAEGRGVCLLHVSRFGNDGAELDRCSDGGLEIRQVIPLGDAFRKVGLCRSDL